MTCGDGNCKNVRSMGCGLMLEGQPWKYSNEGALAFIDRVLREILLRLVVLSMIAHSVRGADPVTNHFDVDFGLAFYT